MKELNIFKVAKMSILDEKERFMATNSPSTEKQNWFANKLLREQGFNTIIEFGDLSKYRASILIDALLNDEEAIKEATTEEATTEEATTEEATTEEATTEEATTEEATTEAEMFLFTEYQQQYCNFEDFKNNFEEQKELEIFDEEVEIVKILGWERIKQILA